MQAANLNTPLKKDAIVTRSPLPPAIFLMGPTATGKTDFALEISQHYPVEVISVDSALVYRGMDIGTAKPDAEFLAKLPHHLIDVCDPDEIYSVARFRKEALALMQEIVSRDRIPLLVGGTMLYFKVLLEGIADVPQIAPSVRERILSEAADKGWPAMHARLLQVDPVTARKIHPNHSQRIQRALEVFESTGEPLSDFHTAQKEVSLPYRILQLALDTDRAVLHERINQRFLKMLEKGFVEEVRVLREKFDLNPDLPSMRAVGYRQVWQRLEGEISEAEMIDMGCAATRQLSKRQFTWLRGWPNLQRISVAEVEAAPGMGENRDWRNQMAAIRPLCDQLDILGNGKRV